MNRSRRSNRSKNKQRGDNTFTGAITSGKMLTLPKQISAVPQRMASKLVWNYGFATSLIAGTSGESATMLINSPYDPDAALGGASAQGFTKLMQFYSKCFTLRSRVLAQVVNTGSTTGGLPSASGTFLLAITTNNTVIPNLNQGIEEGLSIHETLNTTPDNASLRLGVDVGKFLGKPDVLDDPSLYCTSIANPGQFICAHLFVQNWSAVNTLYYTAVITIEFDVLFTDPIPFT